MNRILIAVLVVSGCGAELPVGETDEALIGGSTTGGIRLPPPPQINLTIDSLEPAVPIEHRPVFVHFTVDNRTSSSRYGWVKAKIPLQGAESGPVIESNWFLVWMDPYQSMTGVVELEAPAAGTGWGLFVHYYDANNPDGLVPSETNHPSATMPVALRASFAMNYVWVNLAADNFLGDSDTAYLDETFNGTKLYANNQPLGRLRNGGISGVSLSTPTSNLIPGGPGLANYAARINLQSNGGGVLSDGTSSSYPGWTVALRTLDVDANTVRALVPDNLLVAPNYDGEAALTDHFCNGIASSQPCLRGQTDYTLATTLHRAGPVKDTIPIARPVSQIKFDQSVVLEAKTVDGALVSYAIESGKGKILIVGGNPTYLSEAVSSPMLVKIVASDAIGRTATVYIQVRP